MSSFHSYSCLNRQSLYFFAVALIHSSLSAAVLMKRQSGFGEHKPQIWSGPYPCFDKDGKMKFVGLVFFFFFFFESCPILSSDTVRSLQ